MPDRIAYKIDKAAEVIGLSRSTLYADMHAGILPFLKRKRSRRILHSDLVKYALL
ncbi:MAG: helix-turn-helix domain-containing protein [Rhizobiales bacterium]|nr:helix-turn-helix domain-containing protein [Hyphomicrobiales bacterium]